MRNIFIKIMLAVVALSSLAACGPSEKEKGEALGAAMRAAHKNAMAANNARFDSNLTKQEQTRADLASQQASADYKKAKDEYFTFTNAKK